MRNRVQSSDDAGRFRLRISRVTRERHESPTFHCSVDAGVLIVGTGGWFRPHPRSVKRHAGVGPRARCRPDVLDAGSAALLTVAVYVVAASRLLVGSSVATWLE